MVVISAQRVPEALCVLCHADRSLSRGALGVTWAASTVTRAVRHVGRASRGPWVVGMAESRRFCGARSA